MNRSEMRRCGQRWPTLEAAQTSKRYLAGGQAVQECGYGCEGWHLAAEAKPAAASSSGQRQRKPIPQVSRKRAAQIRERRAMLQAKYPDMVLCEVPYCNEVATDPHEPLTRARLGSITDPENVRAICRKHHSELHDEEPEWGYLLGFLKHSWGDAA